MSEIPNIVFIAIPFALGHLIGYSWLTWQRKKRQNKICYYSSHVRPIRKYKELSDTQELENTIVRLESKLSSLKQQVKNGKGPLDSLVNALGGP